MGFGFVCLADPETIEDCYRYYNEAVEFATQAASTIHTNLDVRVVAAISSIVPALIRRDKTASEQERTLRLVTLTGWLHELDGLYHHTEKDLETPIEYAFFLSDILEIIARLFHGIPLPRDAPPELATDIYKQGMASYSIEEREADVSYRDQFIKLSVVAAYKLSPLLALLPVDDRARVLCDGIDSAGQIIPDSTLADLQTIRGALDPMPVEDQESVMGCFEAVKKPAFPVAFAVTARICMAGRIEPQMVKQALELLDKRKTFKEFREARLITKLREIEPEYILDAMNVITEFKAVKAKDFDSLPVSERANIFADGIDVQGGVMAGSELWRWQTDQKPRKDIVPVKSYVVPHETVTRDVLAGALNMPVVEPGQTETIVIRQEARGDYLYITTLTFSYRTTEGEKKTDKPFQYTGRIETLVECIHAYTMYGNYFVTPHLICDKLYHYSVNTKDITETEELMKLCSKIWITAQIIKTDKSGRPIKKDESGKPIAEEKVECYLLNFTKYESMYLNNSFAQKVYHMLEAPVLIQRCVDKGKGNYSELPIDVMTQKRLSQAEQYKRTPTVRRLESYLFHTVTNINSGYHVSHRMLYSTIFAECGMPKKDSRQRKAAKEQNIPRILQNLKECEVIKGFSLDADGVTIEPGREYFYHLRGRNEQSEGHV